MNVNVKTEQAVMVIARLEDFAGDVEKWKNSFYELWRLQMTYDYAYEISANHNRSDGVFVRLTVKKSYRDNVVDTMSGMGYGNIRTFAALVGKADCPYDDGVSLDCIVLDW